MKKVKSIYLGFENLEGFDVDVKHVGIFFMDNIKNTVSRIACNAISKMTVVDTVAIELFSEANAIYDAFGDKIYKFDRLMQCNDITLIELVYEDDTKETFYVDYEEESEGVLGSPNLNQHTYLSSCGNLYISICLDRNIEDFFDIDDINNVDYVESHKKFIMI